MAAPTIGSATQFYGQPVNVGTFANFTDTNTGLAVKTGQGALYTVTLNKPTATSVITLYDGLSTSGTLIGTITVPASPMPVTLTYNVMFATGLFVVIATAISDVTISFK